MVLDKIDDLRKKLRNIPLEEFIRDILANRTEELEDFNTEQLQRGKRIDGSTLPDYSPVSVAAGKPAGPIRLFDTGDFYEGITAIVSNALEMEGRDVKTDAIEEKYGEVVGLAQESLDKIPAEFLLEELIDLVRKFLT